MTLHWFRGGWSHTIYATFNSLRLYIRKNRKAQHQTGRKTWHRLNFLPARDFQFPFTLLQRRSQTHATVQRLAGLSDGW